MLNKKQQLIVDEAAGTCAVVAGAGSGKTATLVELVRRIHFKDKIPLSEIFLTTFTVKAADELKERLHKKLGIPADAVKDAWIGNFHSLGYRYLRSAGLQSAIMDEGEAKSVLTAIYRDVIPTLAQQKLISADKVYSTIEYMRAKCCPLNQALTKTGAPMGYNNQIIEIFKQYTETKHETKRIDFQDIIQKFYDLIQTDTKIQKQFRWVIVDEAQDNSWHQIAIAKTLAKKNLLMVGDEKQSIYGFRGACPELFQQTIKESDRVFELTQNYRSTPEIIAFLNGMIEQSDRFKDQKLDATRDSLKHTPIFYRQRKSAEMILNGIQLDIKNKVPLKEIVVLGRALKNQITVQDLEMLLRTEGIPYQIVGVHDTMKSKYVRDYFSVLRSVLAPQKLHFCSAVKLIKGIGDSAADSMFHDSSTKEGRDELRSGKYKQNVAMLKYLSLYELSGKELLKQSMEYMTTCFDIWDKNSKDTIASRKKAKSTEKKIEYLWRTVYPYLLKFDDILSGIDELIISRETEEKVNEDKITICTIHKSKGLEWDSVHIYNCNDFSMPMRMPGWDMTEEFCAAYTAASRARKYLRMYTDTYDRFLSPTTPSCFFQYVIDEHPKRIRFKNTEDDTIEKYKAALFEFIV